MKKHLFLLFTLCTLMIFSFAGCRNLNSGSGTQSGDGLTSTVSGVISSVESGGKEVGSAITGAVSGVVSALTSGTSSAR